MGTVVGVFRRRVACVALGASLLWLGLPLTGLGHLGFNDDTACGIETAGPPRATQVQASAGINTLQHCAICHLQRASSGARTAQPIDTATLEDWSNAGPAEAARAFVSSPLDRQPARAPPSPRHS